MHLLMIVGLSKKCFLLLSLKAQTEACIIENTKKRLECQLAKSLLRFLSSGQQDKKSCNKEPLDEVNVACIPTLKVVQSVYDSKNKN